MKIGQKLIAAAMAITGFIFSASTVLALDLPFCPDPGNRTKMVTIIKDFKNLAVAGVSHISVANYALIDEKSGSGQTYYDVLTENWSSYQPGGHSFFANNGFAGLAGSRSINLPGDLKTLSFTLRWRSDVMQAWAPAITQKRYASTTTRIVLPPAPFDSVLMAQKETAKFTSIANNNGLKQKLHL